MNLGIVGYRDFLDEDFIFKKINKWIEKNGKPIKIISGGATGVDSIAIKYAKLHEIPYQEFLPDRSLGKNGLLIRNTLIVNHSDVILAFPSQLSKGTFDTINKGNKKGIPVIIKYVD